VSATTFNIGDRVRVDVGIGYTGVVQALREDDGIEVELEGTQFLDGVQVICGEEQLSPA